MKHALRLQILLLLFAAVPMVSRASAADNYMYVRWTELCRVTGGNELTITTAKGNIVHGHCRSVHTNEIQLSRNFRSAVRIARPNILRIEMKRRLPGGDRLSSLREELGWGFELGTAALCSRYALLGVVLIPSTIA